MKIPKTHKPRKIPVPAAAVTSSRGDLTQIPPNTPVFDVHESIPPQWAWHYRTLCRLREQLTRRLWGRAKAAATSPEMRGVDAADAAQEKQDYDLLWAELGKEEDRLFEVDSALQRIHDGVYGICEETGHTIPPERLRAIPWVRFCRAAAEKRECGHSDSSMTSN